MFSACAAGNILYYYYIHKTCGAAWRSTMKRGEPSRILKPSRMPRQEKGGGAKTKEHPHIPRSASTPPGKAGGLWETFGRAGAIWEGPAPAAHRVGAWLPLGRGRGSLRCARRCLRLRPVCWRLWARGHTGRWLQMCRSSLRARASPNTNRTRKRREVHLGLLEAIASTSTSTSDPELRSGEEVVYPRSGPYPFEYPGKYLRVYSCEDGAEKGDDERSGSEDGTPRVRGSAFPCSVAVYPFPRSVSEYHVPAKSEDAPPTGLVRARFTYGRGHSRALSEHSPSGATQGHDNADLDVDPYADPDEDEGDGEMCTRARSLARLRARKEVRGGV
ncbi:hypothetical protein B0H13DRAFT_652505 [Mycena leptocephala]|nr:hypothetical protein B0H13DRAFT_652505 [Mycena leptocephala]